MSSLGTPALDTLPFPEPRFAHLLAMTDGRGTFEHAEFEVPRREHGYCVDDVARVMVVLSREPFWDSALQELARTTMRFLGAAQGFDGHIRNRMDRRGKWEGSYTVDDCWGRALWAFGTAAARGPEGWVRQAAVMLFERSARQRSPWPRARAFAVLGATEILAIDPRHRGALALTIDAAARMPAPLHDPIWPWPEPRLTYANAVIPEAMIAAGTALGRPELTAHGLELLRWLLELQLIDGHLSVTPAAGLAPGDPRPWFDQQPIEVATLADACARATTVDDDPRWTAGIGAAVEWFLGANDSGRPMWDPLTGGGYDGLQAGDPNLNQGAESTLAVMSTLQHARRLTVVA